MSLFGEGDPLAGLAMPPGDPEVLRRRAGRYDHAAQGLGHSAGRLRSGAAGTVGQAWIGTAATTAGEACGRFATGFDTAARYATDAARALRACADGWEGARSTYRRARRLADEALAEEHHHRAAQQARTASDLAGGDVAAYASDELGAVGLVAWHSPLRAQARALAQTAIDDAHTASTTCARALTPAADTLSPPRPQPVQPSHHTHWWDHGPVGWTVHHAEDVATTTVHGLEDAGNWLAANAAGVARVGNDLAWTAFGVGLTVIGAGAEGGGLVLDASVVGAPAGVVLNVSGAAAMGIGATTAGVFAAKAGHDLSDLVSNAQDNTGGRAGSQNDQSATGGADSPDGANGGLGDLVTVNNPDPSADLLAERIGGKPRVKFRNGPPNEFDAVSGDYVAQAKPANFTLNKDFRDQAKMTFEVAVKARRTPYFQFDGPPGPGVLEALQRYAARYGIEPVIDLTPLGGS